MTIESIVWSEVKLSAPRGKRLPTEKSTFTNCLLRVSGGCLTLNPTRVEGGFDTGPLFVFEKLESLDERRLIATVYEAGKSQVPITVTAYF